MKAKENRYCFDSSVFVHRKMCEIMENMRQKKKLLITASTFPRWEGDTEPRFILDYAVAMDRFYDVTVLVPAAIGAKDSEVINGDAFQIYKGMNIGTAKVREDEKDGITHHLFDICDVDQTFSVFDYQKMCREKLEELLIL